jgi:hypothetical protein
VVLKILDGELGFDRDDDIIRGQSRALRALALKMFVASQTFLLPSRNI